MSLNVLLVTMSGMTMWKELRISDDLQQDDEACKLHHPFMVRGMMSTWKQPSGYFLSHSTIKPKVLHRVLITLLKSCNPWTSHKKQISGDRTFNNCSMFRNIGVTIDKPYFIHLESDILVMVDPRIY
ncbi:hypothetical protein PoB_006840400 [Plakobranchus ocellatus]|uniref:Transposable element P transposase-like RNase H domain-containing protein n=1 Tax=Plakobranchus ocellatus TaxID=259542 RepID=A0AAV4DCH2_9GAST|nr:hypothetical protein PoB_006840400 [Plakobranchus ocellatus]